MQKILVPLTAGAWTFAITVLIIFTAPRLIG